MKKVLKVFPLLLALVIVSCNRTQPGPTVVLIVRHAEKASDADDSPLTDAGTTRAQSLIGVVKNTNVSAIYTTQFRRNHDTAKPLSERTGVAVTEMPVDLQNPGDYGKKLAKDILEKHAGQTVLVVGHSNTVPLIIDALTGQAGSVSGVEYHDLFIVTIPPSGQAGLIKAEYGLP
jgi:broad specificity phosphatase PhoE